MNTNNVIEVNFQQKNLPPSPLKTTENTNQKASIIYHPLIKFDTRTPEELKKQIKIAEEIAKFFKNHWLFFYITIFIGFYRAYKASQTNAAIMRIDKEIKEKK
jgi:uncharacterized protein YydD (DUF2326 family)